MSGTKEVGILRDGFSRGVLQDLDVRKNLIMKLHDMLSLNETKFCEAIFADIGRPSYDSVMCEILTTCYEIKHIHKNLSSWLDDEYVSKSFLFALDSTYIQRQPFGVCLIIGAWNYPVQLLIMGLVGAIAAGNTVLIKPSEISAHTAALITELIPQYLPENVCQVFNGGGKETDSLLTDNRFDFIMYTGGSAVGKIIMQKAAVHLTPVCLELGGKSPTYVDKSANIKMAAKRITWGKYINAGQTCIAPDYIMCHNSVEKEFIEEVKKTLLEFYGENPEKSPDFARVINKKHFDRLKKLLDNTNGDVVVGKNMKEEARYISPTVISNIDINDSLMGEELFGPIMPVMKVSDEDEAIAIVNKGEKPLAAYVFTGSSEVFDKWLKKTSSGGIMQNDVILHVANPMLPFGGVGNSGMGAYHGKHSVDLFSHKRGVVNKTTVQSTDFMRFPPYSESNLSWGRWALSTKKDSCNVM